MTANDWRYLAGLFDGEGCVTVGIVKRKTSSRSGKAGNKIMNTSLRIANNDPRVLLWLEENFGGTVRQHSATRVSWVWIAQGDEAVQAAKQLLKYSRMKKDQLENFIALMALRGRGGVKISDLEWDERQELVDEIRASEFRRQDGLRLIS